VALSAVPTVVVVVIMVIVVVSALADAPTADA
jgi:hypothetical protein